MCRQAALGLSLAVALLSSPSLAACPPTHLLTFGPSRAQALAVGADGNVYALMLYGSVKVYGADGALLRTWGSYGFAPGQFDEPHDLAVDGQGYVYVTDRFHALQKFTSTGTLVSQWNVSRGCTISIDGMTPISVAVDAAGNVYTLAGYTCSVEKRTSSGTPLLSFGSCGNGPGQFHGCDDYAMAIDRQGFVYVSEYWTGRVFKFTTGGAYVGVLGPFQLPVDVAVDGNGTLYVLEEYGHVRTMAGDGTIQCEWDPDDGGVSLAGGPADDIYIAGNTRIAKFGDLATPASRPAWGRLKTLYR